MKKLTAIILISIVFASCQTVEDKTKKVINKGGEVIGSGASEFAKGISEGVDKTLECKISLSEDLQHKGLKTGKFSIETDSSGIHHNKLVLYMIFEKDIKQNISFKVLDNKGLESGRTVLNVNGKTGEAKYVDVIFDPRTDIENRSRITID